MHTLPDGLRPGCGGGGAAGSLPARYVIHTVGPVWGGGGGREAELLASCYRRSLATAVEHGLRTVAFPAISTGAYGYPPAEAAVVVSRTIEDFLDGWPGTLVVISHDRYLVERVCDKVVALFGDGGLTDLPGGIDEYLRRRDKQKDAAAVPSAKPASAPSSAADQRAARKELAFAA